MICFNHQKKQDSSICIVCGKGICKECIIDSGYALVCSEKCLKRHNMFRSLEDNANLTYETQKRNTLIIPAVLIFPGVVFLYFSKDYDYYLFIVGLVFLLLGISLYIKNLKWAKHIK